MLPQPPESFRDLMEGPICVTMVTLMPDGTPHATVVWRRYDNGYWLVGIGKESQKYENLRANPHVTFTAIDPQNPYRYLEVRGEVVEFRPDPPSEWWDELSMLYTRQPYYGNFEPEENRDDTGIIARIKPTRIRANG
ncbi:MAG: TIGR03618 family F420-dependent PPOX class oxidoreductase [Anaerolineae bacterium]|nr:TIGR03618 family F420-dependent PPOX class oxidoreductase [Anaerolineae bacterium]